MGIIRTSWTSSYANMVKTAFLVILKHQFCFDSEIWTVSTGAKIKQPVLTQGWGWSSTHAVYFWIMSEGLIKQSSYRYQLVLFICLEAWIGVTQLPSQKTPAYRGDRYSPRIHTWQPEDLQAASLAPALSLLMAFWPDVETRLSIEVENLLFIHFAKWR